MKYYQHNIGDFAILTQGLDLESVGIVIRMIDRMMSTEKPIKTQWVSLAFQGQTQEKAMCILESLFEETEDGWVLPVLVENIEQYQRNAQKNRENGKKGGRPRKTEIQTKPSGFSEESQTEPKKSLTNKPITSKPINQEVISDAQVKPAPKKTSLVKPAGVSDQVFDDWQKHKKKVCKSCTQHMVDALVREAEKAGITAEGAMVYQLEQGWKGFDAEWYLNRQQRTAPKSNAPLRFDDDYYGDGSF